MFYIITCVKSEFDNSINCLIVSPFQWIVCNTLSMKIEICRNDTIATSAYIFSATLIS